MIKLRNAMMQAALAGAVAAVAFPAAANPCDEPILREMAKGEGNPDGELAVCLAPRAAAARATAVLTYACNDWLAREMARTDGNTDGYFGACHSPAARPDVARAGELAAAEAATAPVR